MSTIEILKQIKQTERTLYKEYREQREEYGRENEGTKNALASWGSVNSLLEELEQSINLNTNNNEA